MSEKEAIKFAGLMEDYLNIPSFVCEMIEKQLEDNKYKEVVEYIIQRRNEIENKPEYISDRNAITMLVNENEEKDKEIERLNNIINELERYINEEYIYDELGMKIFDASKLQDKLQELKGEDKE